ncbi:MAG: 50S ribosomal protein L18 [candidate division Zixibacteria bacterium]|nr:50S ribosomal protein L18 [candidate division Zixibacteria bacterium]
MADKNIVKNKKADRRRRRVRSKIFGTPECPRLTVSRSLKNVTVQIIDDEKKITLVGLASNSKEILKDIKPTEKKTEAAHKVGLKIAELAKAKGIEKVVFDRNQYRFHGRIKAVAEGARKGGLKF